MFSDVQNCQNLEPEVVFEKPNNCSTLEKSCLTVHPLGTTLHVYTCMCRQTHLQWNSSDCLCNDPGLWFLKSFTIESRVFGLVCNLGHSIQPGSDVPEWCSSLWVTFSQVSLLFVFAVWKFWGTEFQQGIWKRKREPWMKGVIVLRSRHEWWGIICKLLGEKKPIYNEHHRLCQCFFFVGNFVLWSTGRFSQIWLQAKYETIF